MKMCALTPSFSLFSLSPTPTNTTDAKTTLGNNNAFTAELKTQIQNNQVPGITVDSVHARTDTSSVTPVATDKKDTGGNGGGTDDGNSAKNKDDDHSGAVIAVVVCLLLAVAGGGVGYLVYQRKQKDGLATTTAGIELFDQEDSVNSSNPLTDPHDGYQMNGQMNSENEE